MKKRNFKLATCSFVTNGLLPSIMYFKNIKNKTVFTPNLQTRAIFEEALAEVQNEQRKVEKSIMIDVINN